MRWIGALLLVASCAVLIYTTLRVLDDDLVAAVFFGLIGVGLLGAGMNVLRPYLRG
jgi:hypothetical protein